MRTIRTAKNRQKILDALREGYSVAGACRAAKVGRTAAWEWRNADETFAAEWDDAILEGSEVLEDEARRRAFAGTDKPVYQGGQMVGTIREYSDTLLIFMLKGRMPEKYRERTQTEVSGTGGKPLTIRVVYGDDGSGTSSPTAETA
jgi:hypothetical protein